LGESFIWYVALAYGLALAVPFVPGAEIGICLMCLFGEKRVFWAYITTVSGLHFSYVIGRLGKSKVDYHSFPLTKKFNTFSIYIPRPLTLAILLNTPGNIIFGGGGGITFALSVENKIKYSQFFMVVTLKTSVILVTILSKVLLLVVLNEELVQ